MPKAISPPNISQRVYLGSPYSHPDPAIRQHRYNLTRAVVHSLVRSNVKVFSPIVYCHELSQTFKLPKGFDFWEKFNQSWLEHWATVMWIDCQPGWEESEGLAGETFFAYRAGKSVLHYHHDTGELLVPITRKETT